MSKYYNYIREIRFNWYVGADGKQHYSTREVGLSGENHGEVLEIKEHEAEGEGDKWYYDVKYADEIYERIFNPNFVVYQKEARY